MVTKKPDRAFIDELRRAPAIRRRGRIGAIIVGSLMLIGGLWAHLYSARAWDRIVERAKASGVSPLNVEPAEFGYRLGRRTGYGIAMAVFTGTLMVVFAGMPLFVGRLHQDRTVALLLRYADQLEAAGLSPDESDRSTG